MCMFCSYPVFLVFQDKLVVDITGDDNFVGKIETALQSFPETSFVEKKPVYRLHANRAGRHDGDKTETM